MLGGEISVRADLHPSGNWITVPISVAGLISLAMVLDTGSAVSAISPAAKDVLGARGLVLPRGDGDGLLLTQLTVQGQALPDLVVRVLPRLARLGIDGLVGLDFLRAFERVSFHVPTLRLVLSLP